MKSLIIIGPSGVGKGTIITQLLKKYEIFQFVVSFTTRKPRPGQIDGKDYNFITHSEFQKRIDSNEMLENKKVFTNYYGTSKQCYFDIIERGKIPLLDIDIEGMKDIRTKIKEEKMKGVAEPQVLCLMPPSWAVLEERLRKRGTESSEVLAQRMKENKDQIKAMMALKGQGLHFVTNYQYQLTLYGIQLFLSNKFSNFRQTYWRTKQEKNIKKPVQ